MTQLHSPDKWVLFKYQSGEVAILSGWSGGYLDGDSWRRSSPIEYASEFYDYWMVATQSSDYKLHKSSVGYNSLTAMIAGQINKAKEEGSDLGYQVEIVDDPEEANKVLRTLV